MINSNSTIASGISSSFSKSASLLNNIDGSVSSGQTNVSGNATAVDSFSSFKSGLTITSDSIVSAGNSIHSVAKEFERIDQSIAQLPPIGFSRGLN